MVWKCHPHHWIGVNVPSTPIRALPARESFLVQNLPHLLPPRLGSRQVISAVADEAAPVVAQNLPWTARLIRARSRSHASQCRSTAWPGCHQLKDATKPGHRASDRYEEAVANRGSRRACSPRRCQLHIVDFADPAIARAGRRGNWLRIGSVHGRRVAFRSRHGPRSRSAGKPTCAIGSPASFRAAVASGMYGALGTDVSDRLFRWLGGTIEGSCRGLPMRRRGNNYGHRNDQFVAARLHLPASPGRTSRIASSGEGNAKPQHWMRKLTGLARCGSGRDAGKA